MQCCNIFHKARTSDYSSLIDVNKRGPRFLCSPVARLTNSQSSVEPTIPLTEIVLGEQPVVPDRDMAETSLPTLWWVLVASEWADRAEWVGLNLPVSSKWCNPMHHTISITDRICNEGTELLVTGCVTYQGRYLTWWPEEFRKESDVRQGTGGRGPAEGEVCAGGRMKVGRSNEGMRRTWRERWTWKTWRCWG